MDKSKPQKAYDKVVELLSIMIVGTAMSLILWGLYLDLTGK